MVLRRATVDLGTRDPAQAGDFRVGAEAGFLRGHSQRGAQVFAAGRNAEQLEGGLDIGRPAFSIGGVFRH